MTLHVEVDAAHGARWTSLRDAAGTEWLWSRPDPRRDGSRPGDAFVDVGGVEECFPTIGGPPDHGDVWTRPWAPDGRWLVARTGDAELRRGLEITGDVVVADYRLDAPPRTRFLWAFHALIDPVPGTRVVAPQGAPVLAFPGHVRPVATRWPDVLEIADWDVLGEDDGSAMFAVLPGTTRLAVHRPADRGAPSELTFDLECPGQPAGTAVWRNLGGYPWAGEPYRNFGVEPILGRTFDLATAGPGDAAVVPAGGVVTWRLTVGVTAGGAVRGTVP